MGKRPKHHHHTTIKRNCHIVSNDSSISNTSDCSSSHPHKKTCNDQRCESRCDEPYRICCNGTIALNVQAPDCLLTDVTYCGLYTTLYNAILNNNLEVALLTMLNTNTQASYNLFIQQLETIFGIPSGAHQASPRLLVALPDGTVVYDSAKADNFTSTVIEPGYNNYFTSRAKAINENHNSRVAVFVPQMFPCGVGYETKLSTTTSTIQAYVGIRAGKFLNNTGTFRWSINVPSL